MDSAIQTKSSKPSGLARWIPAMTWLRTYEKGALRYDAIAGLVLAAYLVPAGLGDASLANLPPQAGLYACIFPALIFWLFCSSRHTVITVTSAISLLVGASLGNIANGDESRFAALAACTALLVAAIAFLAWLVKAGSIVNFISESVMLGFKSGVALFLGSTQLPKLFGFKGSHGSFWERMHYFFQHIGGTNVYALSLGLAALAILVLGKIFFKNRPIAIVVLVGGIAAGAIGNLGSKGVSLIGVIPQGLPMPALPAVHWSDVNDLLPLALACFLLGAVESAAIGRMFAAKHRYRFDSNQEFLSLAASNAFAGFGHAFPVSGGMSQSLVNESASARTPLSGLFAGIVMMFIALFLAGSLRNLPQSVLAAIVLLAISSLFKASALIKLWRFHRQEFIVAAAAMLGVLGSGLLRGVLVGAIISLIQLLRRASRPPVTFAGPIAGSLGSSGEDQEVPGGTELGTLIVRPEASLLYFNVNFICGVIRERTAAWNPRVVVCDLSSSPAIDLQATEAIIEFGHELSTMGVRLLVAEASESVNAMLRLEAEPGFFGPDYRATVATILATTESKADLREVTTGV